MGFVINYKQLIPRLEISAKKNSSAEMQGDYRTAIKGEGSEFYQYSKYVSGDNSAKIDWKASVRAKSLLKKDFIEERKVNVFFLIEASTKMLTGTANQLKAEYAAEITNLCATLAYKAGDHIGYGLFNSEMEIYQKPGATRNVLYSLRKDLITPSNYKKGFQLAESLRFLFNNLQKNSLLFIISDFLSLTNNDIKALRIALENYDLIGIVIRDKIDIELPSFENNIILESPLNNDQLCVYPEKVAEEYKNIALSDTKKLITLFRNSNAEISLFFTDEDYMPQLRRLLEQRSKKYGTK